MNELTIINRIYAHHDDAFTGLSRKQRDAVRNAIGAGYQAGLQAQPTNDMPPMFGPDSETLTPELEATRRALELAGPVPQDDDAFLVYLDRVDTLKREGAMACACEAVA